jgi:tripartite-type tricarboxylate transporter receptor subunit TctC
MSKVNYDPIKDFKPISALGNNPQVLLCNPQVPAKTVQEFVAYAKAQPKPLAYGGGGGPGSASNLIMALFMQRAGIQMTSVSYRGTAPALTDVIAGHIPSTFVPISEALAHAKAGSVRMLAVSSDTRARQVPDVPTIAESGYPGFHAVSWTGLLGPAGTPQSIVDRLAAEFARAVKDPKFLEQLDTNGVNPLGDGPQKFAEMIASEIPLWSKVVKDAGVKLQ